VSSEILSHTSEAYDPCNRIRDIDVETANQGTQIEANWNESQCEEVLEIKKESMPEKTKSSKSIEKKEENQQTRDFSLTQNKVKSQR
jgi:predicted Holliday junction resolvase-like endonuclease